jgi:hypothetical protein
MRINADQSTVGMNHGLSFTRNERISEYMFCFKLSSYCKAIQLMFREGRYAMRKYIAGK